ncbi:hypothetical protein GCM10009430_17810 [Aquimarina litoralis]|uniref:Natural product n=1 Tax=Aquimarina litoralis TaxID=584605 RepID=A0ABP3TW28_9FLAO
MKKGKSKRLSLDKIKIAQLNHIQNIKGGFNPNTATNISTIIDNNTTTSKNCELTSLSTKTVPVSNTRNCI